jgi:hypothetical protein
LSCSPAPYPPYFVPVSTMTKGRFFPIIRKIMKIVVILCLQLLTNTFNFVTLLGKDNIGGAKCRLIA